MTLLAALSRVMAELQTESSVPQPFDSKTVEGLVVADEPRTGCAGRRHDHPVHRITDSGEGSELESLLDVESQDRVPAMWGDRFHNLRRADPQVTPFVEKPDFDDGDRWNVAERPASVARSEAATRRFSEPSRFGQVPDERMRISDEFEQASWCLRRETGRSAPPPFENR